MTRHRTLERAALCIALAIAAAAAPPAFAVNKDLIQIQTQIQDLQDAISKLQRSNDERMGVLKDLVQQSADSVNRMSLSIDALQKQLRTQQDASGAKLDGVSGQVQSVNDSIDEIRARLNNLDKALQNIQTQQQSINAVLQNLAPSPGAGGIGVPDTDVPATGKAPANVPAPQTAPAGKRSGKPSPAVPMASLGTSAPDASPAAATPAAPELYQTALSDYMTAKYTLASAEFSDVIRNYPSDSLAGNAFYYQGEIDYRAGKFGAAVKDYDHVLEEFPDNPKVAVSHLHKANALFELKQSEAGIRELRALIARFPASPEATRARSTLNGMGVPIVPKHP
jgi:TolA-binding protein